MVEIPDIKDEDSLTVWLEDQPRKVSVWIAARAAARVLPVWWHAVLAGGWFDYRNLTSLPSLRRTLVATVAAKSFDPQITAAAKDASSDEIAGIPFSSSAEADGAGRAAVTAATTIDSPYQARLAGFKAARAVDDSATVWASIKRDAIHASEGQLPDALPLWPDWQNPLEKKWSEIKAQVEALPDAADWQFWIDWYDAQLAGRTMLPNPYRTWEMLEKIALIDPATWDAGPEVVNPKIREIWELYHLRVEVAALRAEKEAFLAARASHAQRNHNQPPDGLVDDQPEVARQITIVWDSLDDARDALEQDAPDKGWLRAIAEKLLLALTAVTKYCAKVADTAVISAAKVGGGAGGAAIVDYFANNGRLMQFAKDLLSYAAGV